MSLRKLWNNISPYHRGTYSKDQLLFQVERAHNLLFSKVDVQSIQTMMEWGSGVGHLSRALAKKYNWSSFLCDISSKSLNSAKDMMGEGCAGSFLIPDDLGEIDVSKLPKTDAVLSHAVVWHMPSLEHFRKAFAIWAKVSKRYIFFNVKKGDEVRDLGGNINRNNYGSALLLTQQEVESIVEENGFRIVSVGEFENKEYAGPRINQLFFVCEHK